MADETKTLLWRFIVDATGVEKETRRAADSLASMEGAAKGLTSTLKTIAGVATLGELAKKTIETADAYAEMTNHLRAVTEGAGELHAVQEQLIDASSEMNTTVAATSQNYKTLHDATDGLGMSQQEIIDLTKTVSLSMRLSGKSAEEATGSVDAFGKMLERGTMNLRQFRSLLHDAPALVSAMAEGLGVTVNELKTMADQGELTSRMMIQGLGNASDSVAKKAGDLSSTLKDSFASAASSFGAMIGEFDQGAGITSTWAEMLRDLGETFKGWAKEAQIFGLAFKESWGVITIDFLSFGDQFIQALKLIGIQFLKTLSAVTSGGLLFHDTLAKMDQDVRDQMKRNAELRRDAIASLKEEIQAKLDAISSGTLNKPGANEKDAFTADQVKALQSFGDAMQEVVGRTSDAVKQLAALRVEMTQGKQVADAMRAQLEAEKAGRELEQKIAKQFRDQKLAFGADYQQALHVVIADNAKVQTELKLTADAWGVVNSAMNNAMTDEQKAAKQTDELTRAFEQVKKEIKPTAQQLELMNRALEQIRENANKFPKAVHDAFVSMGDQIAAVKNELQGLNIEMTQGKGAANAFRARLEAEQVGRGKLQELQDAAKASGTTVTQEQIDGVNALTNELARSKQEALDTADAWGLVNRAIDQGTTTTDAATKEVRDMNASLEYLQSHGLKLTDEQLKHFEAGKQKIIDGADDVKQAWQEAGRAVVDNVVNMLAEGSFDIKQFVSSTVREVGRIIIQMLIVKALKSTTWGADLFSHASGNAFSAGRVIPMAAGGVVSQPTFFPMAAGNVGLMGEAGPEAVMPLARLSSGKLGVEAKPSTIHVINNTGVEATARIERAANRTSIVLEAAQLGAQLAEDRITRSMRSGYGPTSTALQRTYALRRRG